MISKIGLLIIIQVSLTFCQTKERSGYPVLPKERIKEIAEMLLSEPLGIGHPITNRDIWDKLSGSEQAHRVIEKANELLGKQPVIVNEELWMDYIEGRAEREVYGNAYSEQDERFCTFVLAEALENKGRFIKSIESILKDMLSLGTWKLPQSAQKVDKGYWYGTKHFVDLRNSRRSFSVATADFWLKERLNPEIRKELREYIKRDVIDPYLKMLTNPGTEEPWFWMTSGNNWTTVCNAGVVGAALSLVEDPVVRATLIAGAEIGVDYFLKEFGNDGFCSENIGYWSYGFGHFMALNEIIRINTKNKIDWLQGPKVARVALFPTRMELLNGLYPSYSDSRAYSRPGKWEMDFAAERLGYIKNAISFWSTELLDETSDLYLIGMLQSQDFPNYDFTDELFEKDYHSDIRDFFPEGGFLVARPLNKDPQGMAVSIKGGHNGEFHNHNDVGSFEVILGSEKLLIDPGAQMYGRESGETAGRYKSEMMNSFGHSVPVVADQLQSPGRDAKALIVEKKFSLSEDYIKFDLSKAYKVSTLQTLTRSFNFKRGNNPELIVTDEVSFTQPENFETAVILDTYDPEIKDKLSARWEQTGNNKWILRKGDEAVEITVSSPDNEIIFKEKRVEAHLTRMPKGYIPMRLGFSLKEKVKSAKVEMKIVPFVN